MIHDLQREQILPAPLEKVWAYFSDPRNLNEITPHAMKFEIVSGGHAGIYAGQIIEYRVEFVRGLRSLWLTGIAHVKPNEYFVDGQRVGPYRFWYHEHRFEAVPAGLEMTDRVTCAVPFGILGGALNWIWIRRRLESIFDFRRAIISEIVGSAA